MRWIAMPAATLFVFSIASACSIEFPDRPNRDGPPDGHQADAILLPPGCGNGSVDNNESCDVAIAQGSLGACPRACNDGLFCTADVLLGEGTCTARCDYRPMSSCRNDDGCCPTGCDADSDSDCSRFCGDGVLNDKEICDTKIPAGQAGACVTTCDDSKACTKDTILNDNTCSAECFHVAITACKSGDHCCPTGCDENSDSDCGSTPLCGNGVVDLGETCDTTIAAGQAGACPTSCTGGQGCETLVLKRPGSCQANCATTLVTACQGNDGCCPATCTSTNDSDCVAPPTCGNGVLDPGETCDTKIAAGQAGACPSSCATKTCKTGSLTGSPCKRTCAYTDASSGASCSGGKCYKGACCAGCWNGSSCVTGTALTACGDAGNTCKSCVDTNVCTTDRCLTSGACSHTYNAASCTGGICYAGSCCTGCWNGSSCVTGTTVSSCGTAGHTCTNCKDTNICTTDYCLTSGACSHKNNTAACSGGICHAGKCCTGCWTGSSCVGGTSDAACGDNGEDCQICGTSKCCSTGHTCATTPPANCMQ